MDPARHIDRLFRYQRVIRNQVEWQDLEFGGKVAIEVGCGPLLGWGPLAVYLGARRYLCLEPRFRHEIMESPEIQQRYFLPMHQQLEAIYQRGVSLDEFMSRLSDRIEIRTVAVQEWDLAPGGADVLLSNSVLQHVGDPLDGIRSLVRAAAPGARHFHVVNFADHPKDPVRPFAKMYSADPEAYRQESILLNLKRPSELLALFEHCGEPVRLVPYYRDPNIGAMKKAEYWNRFSNDDLSIQMGFLVS